jgi:putative membrane protein
VADANPVGLIVRWPEAETLADDQWVEVTGRFEAGSFDGEPTPILVIETLTPTDPPAQPYLYL